MTGYIVLTTNEEVWVVVDTFQARGAEHAVQQAADKLATGATFVAVPERSWKPMRVTRTEVVQTKVEAAS